jgi:hypothetical protein
MVVYLYTIMGFTISDTFGIRDFMYYAFPKCHDMQSMHAILTTVESTDCISEVC